MKTIKIALAFLVLGVVSEVRALPKVRLVYGESWQRAGRDVRKTLESEAWKRLAGEKYEVEFVDEAGNPDGKLNLGSSRLPCIFALDDRGRCFFVKENVRYDISAKSLFNEVETVAARRNEIEKRFQLTSADGCGQLLQAMEPYVGGPGRVIGKNFYGDVFEKLKALDPEDKEGWQRHFTMGDGLQLVTQATGYRTGGKVEEGEAWAKAERKRPSRHLTTEQKQAVLLSHFALYAPDDMGKPWKHPKRDEMVALLRRIAEADEYTLWGAAALGWLASAAIGEPPLSVYWGWRVGDFPKGRFEQTVRYGVRRAFDTAGEYRIELTAKSGKSPKFGSIRLFIGKSEIARIDKMPFTVRISPAEAGKITSMVVRGEGIEDSTGTFSITRKILRDR